MHKTILALTAILVGVGFGWFALNGVPTSQSDITQITMMIGVATAIWVFSSTIIHQN